MDSKIVGSGIFADTKQQVDPTHHAARVSLRPADVGVLGSYSDSRVSGVMAAGLTAGSPIYAFRWASSVVMAIIRRVRITAGTDGTAFAQGSVILDMIRATGYTVADTGGAAISLAGRSQARAVRFAASQIQLAAATTGQIVVAGTATLTAGTRTLDSAAMGTLVGAVGANPAIQPVAQPGLIWDKMEPWQGLELLTSEGFIIRATVPATGTWKFAVDVDWDEVDPTKYFG